jgi:hypothetical protein
MKLSVYMDSTNNRIVIKPIKQTYAGIRGWSDIALTDKDKVYVDNIAKDISSRL